MKHYEDNTLQIVADNHEHELRLMVQASMIGDAAYLFGKPLRMIQDTRIIPDRFAESNHFPTDFIYLSFRYPNNFNSKKVENFGFDNMRIIPIIETLLTATHFKQIISKN